MSHRVILLAEWLANPQTAAASAIDASVAYLCKSHGKAADLYDLACGLFLCGQCVLAHVDHANRIMPVAEAAIVCRAELDGWLGRCEHWDKRIAATDQACDRRGNEVQAAHGVAKDVLEGQEKLVPWGRAELFCCQCWDAD